MVISFAEAKQIALAKIGPDCGLIETATMEKPYGWYFYAQSRAFIETGDFMEMHCGSCGFIVERADGRVFQFGSAFPLEKWIADYEKGFKYDRYDLTILAVSDLAVATELLERLYLHYVVPEEENGTVWMIPQYYTRDQIQTKLTQLPFTFANQAFWHVADVFDEIAASGACKYELLEHSEG